MTTTGPVKRSSIRNWVLGEMCNNAKVIVVKQRDYPEFLKAVDNATNQATKIMLDAGIAVIDDEGKQ